MTVVGLELHSLLLCWGPSAADTLKVAVAQHSMLAGAEGLRDYENNAFD